MKGISPGPSFYSSGTDGALEAVMINSNNASLTHPRRSTPRRRLPAALLCTGLALLGMTGCSKVKSTAKGVANRALLRPSPTGLKVGIDPDANRNSPVALDVVLIKDKNFWKAAPAMSAKDWFAQKNDLQRRYGKKMQVQSWEWVPGQPIGPITVKAPRGLSGAMVFANYPTPGTHSAPLPLGSKININLQKDDFTMEQGK
ncbi:MAG TPA: hypothetical protein VHW72_21380 [Candidatus Angelobacter sp.]|nr:hypothetical protein [Candidatus Angelobacter sp.]